MCVPPWAVSIYTFGPRCGRYLFASLRCVITTDAQNPIICFPQKGYRAVLGGSDCNPRLFTVPFSVNSPAAPEGGTSTNNAATIRLELPVPVAANSVNRSPKIPRRIWFEAVCAGLALRSRPATSAHASQSGKMSIRTSSRSAPTITTSFASGRSTSSAVSRSLPALTRVPEVSLKSSLIRPIKAQTRSWPFWIDEAEQITRAEEAIFIEGRFGGRSIPPITGE
jgi:hypothetical protein